MIDWSKLVRKYKTRYIFFHNGGNNRILDPESIIPRKLKLSIADFKAISDRLYNQNKKIILEN